MIWKFSDDKPIYSQIIELIQSAVVSGELSPGERISSVRELAEDAGVNPNTMQKALSELERTGLVHSLRTSGRFITSNDDIISELKESLAKKKISSFLQYMNRIGYTNEQTALLIKNFKEDCENE